MKLFRNRYFVGAVAVVIIYALTIGCGKKAPPTAPNPAASYVR